MDVEEDQTLGDLVKSIRIGRQSHLTLAEELAGQA